MEMPEIISKMSSYMVETGVFTLELIFPGKHTLYGTDFKSYMSKHSLSLLHNIVLINLYVISLDLSFCSSNLRCLLKFLCYQQLCSQRTHSFV